MPAPILHAVAVAKLRIGTGDRIQIVVAEDVVDGVIDVEAADVAESRFAEVRGADLVRREDADRRGTHQDAVAVVVERGRRRARSGR